MSKTKVAIVGATGYGGAEIIRNLLFHPNVEITRLIAIDRVGEPIGEVHNSLYGKTDLRVENVPVEDVAPEVDAMFFALPHKTTAEIAMRVFDSGVPLIDLSGDFRLQSADAYAAYYAPGHPCHEESASFVYGMPELNREALKSAKRVASPGCFATTIALGLLPVARAGVLDGPCRVVAMTGSSGSGAAARATTHHPLRAKNLRTYKPLNHQHTPEIEQTLRLAGANEGFALQFIPVSAPLVRGIFSTAFVEVPESTTDEDVDRWFDSAFGNEPFVKVVRHRKPEVNAIAGSMYVEVGWHLDTAAHGGKRTLVCFSALDNLVKGGAGQAVQAFNLVMGFDERAGLERPALWP